MGAKRVAIVDSGGANIASLIHALRRLGVTSELTRDAHNIAQASHVILPGVGAAADAMQRLDAGSLPPVIRNLRQPVLGICLGLQLLAESSEEGATRCLNIVPGVAKRLTASTQSPVPNIGWCKVTHHQHEIFSGIDDASYFYFLHSFALPPSTYTLATAAHDTPFTAALARDNFFAAQFHPERSADAGAQFLKNFLGLGS